MSLFRQREAHRRWSHMFAGATLHVRAECLFSSASSTSQRKATSTVPVSGDLVILLLLAIARVLLHPLPLGLALATTPPTIARWKMRRPRNARHGPPYIFICPISPWVKIRPIAGRREAQGRSRSNGSGRPSTRLIYTSTRLV
jgi:hypothetical protein